jgi:hypothetical protein
LFGILTVFSWHPGRDTMRPNTRIHLCGHQYKNNANTTRAEEGGPLALHPGATHQSFPSGA